MNKFLTLLLLCFSMLLFSQRRPHKTTGIVTGKLLENTTKKPIEYASLYLENKTTHKIVDGGLTNEKGKFVMENIPLGDYILTFETINLNELQVPFTLTEKTKFINLKKIYIEESNLIEEITYQSEKKLITQKPDRQIIDPTQLIGSESMTTSEILNTTPIIDVDLDGNVSMRGSSKITYLVDGRPLDVQLDSGSVLDLYPADVIEKIELITNPSAKYNPEGKGGIINLILKKKGVEGYNGSVSLGTETNPAYNVGTNLSYQKNKVKISSSLGYRKRERDGTTEYTKTNFDESIIKYTQNSKVKSDFKRISLRGDYYINKRNTLNLSTSFFNFNFNPNNTVRYENDFIDNSIPDTYYTQNNENEVDGRNYRMGLGYDLKFLKPDHKISFNTQYSIFNLENETYGVQQFTDSTFNNNQGNSIISDFLTKVKSKSFNTQVDYENTFEDILKLEAGLIADLRNSNSNFNKENLIDLYNFNRDIVALYATLFKEWKTTNIQVGLRTEKVFTKANFVNNDNAGILGTNTVSVNEFNWYPNIAILQKLSPSTELKLNYNRRVSRAGGRRLNPFRRDTDTQNITVGNPFLKSEFINLYEIGINQDINQRKGTVGITGFYRFIKDGIQRITYFEDQIDNNVVVGEIAVNTYDNLGKERNYGLEFSLQYRLYKWWNLNGGVTYYYSDLEAEGYEDLANKGSNFNAKLNQQFKLFKNWSLQLNNRYRGKSLRPRGFSKPYLITNLAISKRFLDQKISLSLRFNDIFDQRKLAYEDETDDFLQIGSRKRISQTIGISFSYRFGNLKAKRPNGSRKNSSSGRDRSSDDDDLDF